MRSNRGPYCKLTVKERLLKNRIIDEQTGCWIWTKAHDRDGYGIITIDKKTYRVHRVSFIEFNGPLINNALHKLVCRNRRCFNPEHLYDGTQADNNYDAVLAGTHKSGFSKIR